MDEKDIDKKGIENGKSTKNKFNKGFFKKLYYSIIKIEKYPEMATEGLPKAIIYLVKLIAIFAVISCLGTIYQLSNLLKDGVNYLSESFPDFSYQDGTLQVQSDEVLIYEETPQFGKVIIDTKEENEEKINEYTTQITDAGDGAIILKDKIIIKTQSVMGTANYNYAELFGQMGLNSFNKQDVINYINSSQIMSLYVNVFIMIFIYTFVIYFFNILTYIIFISLFGCIANLLTKLRMRYVAVFNMAVYSVTLSTILYMIYVGVNIFVPFTIKYFEPMYISVATIYLIAAIFILKSETIKKQMEIIRIQEVQKQVREDLTDEKEHDKENEKEKNKDTGDKDKEDKEKEEQNENNEKNKRKKEEGQEGELA